MKEAWPPSPPANPEPSFEIPLGPYVLHDIVGKGGMGEVWKGVHRDEGIEVAVKVITGEHAKTPRFVSAFRREVQTIAGLSHPGIIMVLDFGELPHAVEVASGGRISAGSPFLAMECADGGGLGATLWKERMGWEVIRATLLDLLHALAHAHARGVVHLDFKPDNILWCHPTHTARGRWKLSDFGIAHVTDVETRLGNVQQSIGTPSFMAPEQIMGLFRDYGPPTDLYALGCTAYMMASGSLPFTVKNLQELANLHLHADAPPLVPHCPIPEGFEGWIQRLLQKNPRHRFQRAADAAYALERLGDPPAPTPEPEAGPDEATSLTSVHRLRRQHKQAERSARSSDQTRQLDATAQMNIQHIEALRSSSEFLARREAPKLALPLAPPIPVEWRPSGAAQTSIELSGAGLGLWGLRSIPFVGRERERDHLWRALQRVDRTQSAALIALRGDAGTGKSRLAEWLCERTHEFGAATALRAYHSPTDGPTDGLPRMLARHLHCAGLSYRETLERCERLLREQGVTEIWEWEALAELLSGARHEEHHGASFDSASERYNLMRRFIDRAAHERPVIVWLDDAQYNKNAIGFARAILEAQRAHNAPILVVMTLQNEALAARPEVLDKFEALARHPLAEVIDVAPLDHDACVDLVQGLLGLEPDLTERVVQRCAGNPLFAVQIVGNWVQHNQLQPSPRGFVLKHEGDHGLPHGIDHLWKRRLDVLLEGRPHDDRVAVELAATLGLEVTYTEWRGACRVANLTPTNDLVHRLVSNGLARWTQEGWSFVHGMLRENASAGSRAAGRWDTLNVVCADMLREHQRTKPTRGVMERVARHYLQANAFEQAINPLLAAVGERTALGEFASAEQLLELREQALHNANTVPSDRRWPEGWVERAALLRRRARYDEVLALAKRAERHANSHNHPLILGHAILNMAVTRFDQGHHERAFELYERAFRSFDLLGDKMGMAQCRVGLGDICHMRGDMSDAKGHYTQALLWRKEANDTRGIAESIYHLASVTNNGGDAAKAKALFEEALSLHESRGYAPGVVNCLNGLGEVARSLGHLDEAERHYRRALALYQSMDSANVLIARINIALVLLARHAFPEAHAVLLIAHDEALKTGRDALLGGVHAELLPCVAHAADWAAWDEHMKQASILLSTSGVADPDDAWPAQLGADIAAQAGQTRRAKTAYAFARRLWIRLGRAEKVDAIDAAMARL